MKSKQGPLMLSAMIVSCFVAAINSVDGLPDARSIFIAPTSYRAARASSKSEEGARIFHRANCASCHSIEKVGGCLAPPLDGIGARRSRRFILARITNSPDEIRAFQQMYKPQELFEHPRLKRDDANSITAFLLTLPESDNGYTVLKHSVIAREDNSNLAMSNDAAASIEKGRAVFATRGCLACHSLGGLGGHFAPALDGENRRRERKYVIDRITNSEFLIPNSPDEYGEKGLVMPPSNLTAEEIVQITDFIMSLPEKPDSPE